MVFGNLKIFKTESVNDYQGVLVPLANAQRHSTVEADYARRRSEDEQNHSDGDLASGKKEADEKAGVNPNSVGAMYTVEGLRKEIEAEVGAGGADTSYDLKSKVINKAIQDIGMGRYNWQLFGLCGFGWFADK